MKKKLGLFSFLLIIFSSVSLFSEGYLDFSKRYLNFSFSLGNIVESAPAAETSGQTASFRYDFAGFYDDNPVGFGEIIEIGGPIGLSSRNKLNGNVIEINPTDLDLGLNASLVFGVAFDVPFMLGFNFYGLVGPNFDFWKISRNNVTTTEFLIGSDITVGFRFLPAKKFQFVMSFDFVHNYLQIGTTEMNDKKYGLDLGTSFSKLKINFGFGITVD